MCDFFLQWKIFFLHLGRTSPEETCSNCPLSCAPLWREIQLWGVGKLWLDLPWAFFSLGWINPVPSNTCWALQSCKHGLGPPLDPLQFFCLSLDLSRTKTEHGHSGALYLPFCYKTFNWVRDLLPYPRITLRFPKSPQWKPRLLLKLGGIYHMGETTSRWETVPTSQTTQQRPLVSLSHASQPPALYARCNSSY